MQEIIMTYPLLSLAALAIVCITICKMFQSLIRAVIHHTIDDLLDEEDQ